MKKKPPKTVYDYRPTVDELAVWSKEWDEFNGRIKLLHEMTKRIGSQVFKRRGKWRYKWSPAEIAAMKKRKPLEINTIKPFKLPKGYKGNPKYVSVVDMMKKDQSAENKRLSKEADVLASKKRKQVPIGYTLTPGYIYPGKKKKRKFKISKSVKVFIGESAIKAWKKS